MGLNFRRSVTILPGVRLNFGKKSVGVSAGGRYGGVSYNSRTGARARVSAPGTGLSYTTRLGGNSSAARTQTSGTSNDASSKRSGGCLMSCLKGLCYLCFLPLAWIAGVVWCFTKRKKLNDEPELQKKETLKVVLLSVLSFAVMLSSPPSSNSSSDDALLSTEVLNTESIEQIATETYDTDVIETSTIFSSEIIDTVDSSEDIVDDTIETPVAETEAPAIETEAPVVVEQPSTQAQEPEAQAVLVWIDKTADKYHKKNGCGMDNAYQVTLEEAIALEKAPCGRCY